MCERDSGHTRGSGKAKERVAVLEVARGTTATVYCCADSGFTAGSPRLLSRLAFGEVRGEQ